jgi:hypothetical protein
MVSTTRHTNSTGIIQISSDTAHACYTIYNAACPYVAAVVARVATEPAGRRCLELGAAETAPGVAVPVTKLAMVCRAASFPLSSLAGLPERVWVPGVSHGMAGQSKSVSGPAPHPSYAGTVPEPCSVHAPELCVHRGDTQHNSRARNTTDATQITYPLRTGRRSTRLEMPAAVCISAAPWRRSSAPRARTSQ